MVAALLDRLGVDPALVDNPRVALVGATGSTRMGREAAPKVAARFARGILELGGNNALILGPSAILFSAVGTAGQRCTTLRRLIAHESVKQEIVSRLKAAYAKVRIGHPLEGNLVGPLIDRHSFDAMRDALEQPRGPMPADCHLIQQKRQSGRRFYPMWLAYMVRDVAVAHYECALR